MRVLIAAEPGVDGVFRYVEALCHYLVGEGVEVHLAYSTRRGSDRLAKLVAFIAEQGGETLNLGVTNHPELADFSAFLRLRKMVRRIRPDIIHSNSSKAGVLARGLAFFGERVAQLYHPHAYRGMRPNRSAVDLVYDAIEALFARVGYTANISMAEYHHACARLHVSGERLQFLPNGVDTGKFTPVSATERARLREHFGLPRDSLVLGAMGRFSAQKDPLTVYRAFALSAAAHPEICLFHVGSGELEAEAAAFIESAGLSRRVIRLRYLATPDQFYQAVDGFILTSRYEGFSLAALEALATNLPVILSEAPGNSDLLGIGLSHAWSALPGDFEGFARGIADWYQKSGDRQSPNHRQIAVERFNATDRLAAVLRCYRHLLGRQTKPARPWSDKVPATTQSAEQ